MGLKDFISKLLEKNNVNIQTQKHILNTISNMSDILAILLAIITILSFFGIQFSNFSNFYDSLSIDAKVSLWGLLNMCFTYYIVTIKHSS